MTQEHERVTVDVIHEMARMAGLKVDRRRAERLRDEVGAALDAVDSLDGAIDPESPGTAGVATFDPRWDGQKERSRS